MSEFGSLNLEDMAGEDSIFSNNGGKNNFKDQFVPMPDVRPGQSGTITLRILPPVKGGKLFQYNRVHTINGRKCQCPRPIVNGKVDWKVPCPICDYVRKLWMEIDKLEKTHGKNCPEAKHLKDEARALKAAERYYYNAIVRSLLVDGKESKNDGPRILSVGINVHKIIMRALTGDPNEPNSKLGNVTDLKNGWDLIIKKDVSVGEDAFPKYDRSDFARVQSPAGTPEEIAKWAASLHDLTKFRNPKSAEALEKELAIYRGYIPDDTEGFDLQAFENKWRSKSNGVTSTVTVSASPVPNTTTVVVPAGVPTSGGEPVAENTVPTVSDSIGVDEQKFLEEIEAMTMD